jgi:hypothetical protein
MFSRRDLLVASAGAAMTVSAAKAATFGNPDEPPQGAINAKGPGNLSDPGPQNPMLGSQFPSEWRLGTRGHGKRFRDLQGDLRREHAVDRGRHS